MKPEYLIYCPREGELSPGMREYLARDLQVCNKRTGDNRICHLLRARPSLGSWLVNDKSLFAIHAGQRAWTRLTYDQRDEGTRYLSSILASFFTRS